MAGQTRWWQKRGNNRHLPGLLSAPSSGAAEARRDLERTLHDKVAVGMSAMAVQLDLVSGAEDTGDKSARIAMIRDTLRDVVDDLRQVGKLLYPPMLGGEQLEPALRAVAEQRRLRLRLEFPPRDLSKDAKARVGLLLTDYLYTLVPGTVVHVRVRGRRLVRVTITEDLLGQNRQRTYRTWLRCA